MPTTWRQPCWNWMSCGHVCGKRRTKLGCGIALCRKTRPVVAYAASRSKRKDLGACLWEALPLPYRNGHCAHRFLVGRPDGDPQRDQHSATGKETGETVRAGTVE